MVILFKIPQVSIKTTWSHSMDLYLCAVIPDTQYIGGLGNRNWITQTRNGTLYHYDLLCDVVTIKINIS